MKLIIGLFALLAVAAGDSGTSAQATPPAHIPPTTATNPPSDPALTLARHLWPGNPVCRRLRVRGWRYGIWEARAAYRRHCRSRMRGPGRRGPRVGRRGCRRLWVRGWEWGDRQARRRYRRFCAN